MKTYQVTFLFACNDGVLVNTKFLPNEEMFYSGHYTIGKTIELKEVHEGQLTREEID
jgi:hypothetical protein